MLVNEGVELWSRHTSVFSDGNSFKILLSVDLAT